MNAPVNTPLPVVKTATSSVPPRPASPGAEALAALCSLADVSVHTATAEEAPMGTVLEYAHDGTLREERKAARTRGTTVTVTQRTCPCAGVSWKRTSSASTPRRMQSSRRTR